MSLLEIISDPIIPPFQQGYSCRNYKYQCFESHSHWHMAADVIICDRYPARGVHP